MSESLNFKLEIFEGPLDLLLSLISKNKVDIYDIPISLILDQYLEYLEEMRRMDMDIAGEFITMASELMLIKSRMLLPKSPLEEDIDPRERLAQALIEYKRAKEAAVMLNENYMKYAGRIAKPMDEAPFQAIPELADQDAKLLEEAFARLMQRAKQLKETMQPPEKTLENLLKKRVTPVPERIVGIMRYLYKNGRTSFDDLMLQSKTRSDIIASFAALLELLKARRVMIAKDDGDEIVLELNKRGKNSNEQKE
ncbi:MAG: segregation/condensation protein A [Clostridia bacterium]|nr:segregation/condensation protein A [Clostridia bacterium]